MKKTPPWRVERYKSDDGADPFMDFAVRLRSEPKRRLERAECLSFIRLLRKQGGILEGDETYLTHPDGRRIFRGQFVHILYRCYPGERLVVLHKGRLAGEPDELFDDTF